MTTASPQFTSIERDGRIMIVMLRRPELGNALHGPANQELASLFDEFAADDSAGVAILTGEGASFCAGEDPAEADAAFGELLPTSGFGGLTSRFDNVKPVIAAVNGDATGAGFELALACDLIIASERAGFALNQSRDGRVPRAGGVHRLVRQAPLKEAMAALLLGRRIPAAEGVLLGFVNEIVPPGLELDRAKQLAGEILLASPAAIRAIKQSALGGLTLGSIEAAISARYPAMVALELRQADVARREGREPL